MALPEYLVASGRLLREAFPTGLPEEDWPALFRAIYWDFSNRNLSMVVDDFLGTEDGFYDLLNRFRSDPPERALVEAIQSRLEAVGWDSEYDGGEF